MSENNVVELSGREVERDELTELLRSGARKLIDEALKVEVSELLLPSPFRKCRDPAGSKMLIEHRFSIPRSMTRSSL